MCSSVVWNEIELEEERRPCCAMLCCAMLCCAVLCFTQSDLTALYCEYFPLTYLFTSALNRYSFTHTDLK